MCTAPAADDEKKHLLRLVCGNDLAIDAYHAMPLRAFAFSEVRATVYGATPAAIEDHRGSKSVEISIHRQSILAVPATPSRVAASFLNELYSVRSVLKLYELYSNDPQAPGANVGTWKTPSSRPQPSRTSMTHIITTRIAASANTPASDLKPSPSARQSSRFRGQMLDGQRPSTISQIVCAVTF